VSTPWVPSLAAQHLVHRLPTRLHPILRSGTSFVDGCQHREHLALRLGTSCIDCRLVCTPSCDQVPRLPTGVNVVSTGPCGRARRTSTADSFAPHLAIGRLVGRRCQRRKHLALRLSTSCIDGWQKRNWPRDPLQPAVSPDTNCLATVRLGDRLAVGCRLATDPSGLTSIQIRYSLFLRTGVSVLHRGPSCSQAAGPSTAQSRTPRSRDE